MIIALLAVLAVLVSCIAVLALRPARVKTVNVEVTRQVQITQEVTRQVPFYVEITATNAPTFTPTNTLAPTNTPLPTNTALPTFIITPLPSPTIMADATFVAETILVNGGHVQVWWDKVVVGEMTDGGIWVMDRETFYSTEENIGGLDMPGVKAMYILIQGKVTRFWFQNGAWSYKPSPQGGIGYCVAADCSDQLTSIGSPTAQEEILALFRALEAGQVRVGTSQFYNHVFWLRGNPAPVVGTPVPNR